MRNNKYWKTGPNVPVCISKVYSSRGKASHGEDKASWAGYDVCRDGQENNVKECSFKSCAH